MDNDIVLLNEDNNTITITCDKVAYANSYTVLGMNDYSAYEIIAKTNNNVITLERRRIAMYHNLKIDYIYDGIARTTIQHVKENHKKSKGRPKSLGERNKASV